MAMWKEAVPSRPASTPVPETRDPVRFDAPPKPELVPAPTPTPVAAAAPRANPSVARKESLIADDITIEGKIKGDVNVQGDLTIESGAKLTGGVRADKVTIAGELEGNVEQSSHVDLLQTGVVIGDLKAGSVTVAAGARMRGQAEFGWDEGNSSKAGKYSGGL